MEQLDIFGNLVNKNNNAQTPIGLCKVDNGEYIFYKFDGKTGYLQPGILNSEYK